MGKATIVLDLGFGDAGKGTIVDFLSRIRPQVTTVVRFNGGAQAAHNVVTPDGKHHTFAQFGSGSFNPGIKTHLSRFMVVDPFALVNEASHLEHLGVSNPFALLTVDGEAKVATPFNKVVNRLREISRGSAQHGTCGMGIGDVMSDSLHHSSRTIFASDLRDRDLLEKKLQHIQEIKLAECVLLPKWVQEHELSSIEFAKLYDKKLPSVLADALWRIAMKFPIVDRGYLKRSMGDEIIFEGAQGVLLDEWHGFHPHTTWSKTNADNALSILADIGFTGHIEKIGILRSYAVRHGAGPFPTEDSSFIIPEGQNTDTGWQGKFRRGWFDVMLSQYAIDACGGIDTFIMTHLDSIKHMGGTVPVSVGYKDSSSVCSIRQLDVQPRGDELATQDRLTNYLASIAPIYTHTTNVSPEAYARTVATHLQVPLRIVSYGPTAGDKIVL